MEDQSISKNSEMEKYVYLQTVETLGSSRSLKSTTLVIKNPHTFQKTDNILKEKPTQSMF